MPNIANALKAEISRIARKEIRAETGSLKKAIAAYRTEIAALKRRAQSLEKQLRSMGRRSSRVEAPPEAIDASPSLRFSAKGLVAQRKRLGISARECGLLFGTSAQTVYNWEEGKARPRAKHLAAIAALRGLGKRAARAHLQSLD
ncbi:MAG: helix-turn-helix transcriptional regulator [Burkholderiales bacterium]|nr:helix-turn-helix transcriptional regulator [Burkholderiales bacterium]